MNKELYLKHSMIQALDNDPCFLEVPPFVDDNSEIANVFKEIFAVDERTGLPQGEIAYYLSPDGNPSIKDWLLNNLMKARNISIGPSTEGVSDDLLYEFSRQPNESVGDYRQRIYDFGMEAKKFLDENKPKDE